MSFNCTFLYINDTKVLNLNIIFVLLYHFTRTSFEFPLLFCTLQSVTELILFFFNNFAKKSEKMRP